MADWTNITDTAVDPDAPLTSQLGYAWRDNPIAIAEGATGAPLIVPRAMNNWYGRVQLDSTTPSVVISGLDSSTTLAIVGSFSYGASVTSLQISGSADGGSTWGSWFTIVNSPKQNTLYSIHLVLNLNNGIYDSVFTNPGDLGAGPFNAIRFRHSGSMVDSATNIAVYGIGRSP